MPLNLQLGKPSYKSVVYCSIVILRQYDEMINQSTVCSTFWNETWRGSSCIEIEYWDGFQGESVALPNQIKSIQGIGIHLIILG